MAEPSGNDLVARAFAAIDAANAADPVSVRFRGETRPKELVHAERMTHWVQVLDPDADAAQRLAARAHHLRRWSVARNDYPDGRAGYLEWRLVQRKRQVTELSELLAEIGFDPATTERALAIVAKKGLGSDPAVQTHEDALCLVFLELQLDELAARLDHDRMIDVLRKSIAKMSPHGVETAGAVELSEQGQKLLQEAVSAEHTN